VSTEVMEGGDGRGRPDDALPVQTETEPVPRMTSPRRSRLSRPRRLALQIAIAVLFLLAWQYLPEVSFLSSHIRLFDRFYISSPSEVWQTLGRLADGSHNTPLLWPYLWTTVEATIVGSAIGLIIGALVGLLFSNSPTLSAVLNPFLVLLNSVPRIALIPIFVLLVGPTKEASSLSVIVVVFFLGFFNAYEGGISVRQAVIDNVTLLGASRLQTMRYVRLPSVMTWTFAAVPNAISFGLVVAVATELFAGIPGMGYILLTSTSNVEASLTFAIIVVLSIVGLILYILTSMLRTRVLHWQGK
jgi:sulfonate transport system permease protein